MSSKLRQLPELPERLSDCLEVALADLERVEKLPNYVVAMDTFHATEKGKCCVCLAGAAMVGLGTPTKAACCPFDFSQHNAAMLDEISNIAIDCHCIEEIEHLQHVEYADDRDGFKQYIRDCIAALREAGK